MDRKLSITDVLQYFLQFGVDALNIFISAYGVLVFVVAVFVVANMIRNDLRKKRVIKELTRKKNFDRQKPKHLKKKK